MRRKKVFDDNKGDYEAIKQRLNGIDWNEYLHGDTENRWQTFKNLIHQLQQAHIPLKASKCTVKKAMWLDKKALTAVQKKRLLFSKYKDNSHHAVKSQNKKAKKELIRTRRKFEKACREH